MQKYGMFPSVYSLSVRFVSIPNPKSKVKFLKSRQKMTICEIGLVFNYDAMFKKKAAFEKHCLNCLIALKSYFLEGIPTLKAILS